MAHYTKPNLSRVARRRIGGFFKITSTLSETFVFFYIGTSLITNEPDRVYRKVLPFMVSLPHCMGQYRCSTSCRTSSKHACAHTSSLSRNSCCESCSCLFHQVGLVNGTKRCLGVLGSSCKRAVHTCLPATAAGVPPGAGGVPGSPCVAPVGPDQPGSREGQPHPPVAAVHAVVVWAAGGHGLCPGHAGQPRSPWYAESPPCAGPHAR